MISDEIPISVLHIVRAAPGGVPGFVLALASDQIHRGWQVFVACPPGALAEDVAAAGAIHHPWAARRDPGPGVVAETIRIRRVIGASKPDLIHLHSSKAGLAGRLALRRRRPTVFQPHAWSFEALLGPARAAAIAWERLAARWADVVVCVSQAELDRGKGVGIRADWRVIPNGVDLQRLREASRDERAAARLRLNLHDSRLVVCVGRLSRQKGQDVLLEAWPSVLERVPAAALVLVGDGPEEDRLRACAGSGVRFTGHRDDVASWLAAADVVAVPSRWEGMSIAMLEAMARGRSIVATDVPGAREALGSHAGAIVPVDEPRALADALVARLLNPNEAAIEGRAARLRAEQHYSFVTTAAAMANLYRELLERRRQAISSGNTRARIP
jgi:glycosyltransferase involved in cell wall biosynthesis